MSRLPHTSAAVLWPSRIAAALLGSAIALLALSCGSAHPHEFSTEETGPALTGSVPTPGASTSLLAPTTTEPTCNVGTNGDVCACVDEPLAANAPNLYFVLDRSQSMANDGKWTTIKSVLGSLVAKLGTRALIGAAVFPSPFSNPDGCSPGAEVFSPRPGGSGTASTLLNTASLNTLPAGGTPTAATLRGLAGRIETLRGKKYVVLATDGGPNCNADADCGALECQTNIESVPPCSPQGENCCSPAKGGDPRACLDGAPTVAAVAAFAAAGVPVYVVGVPGSAPYAALLDQLAVAGGTSRGSEPQYYDVTSADPSAFESALSKIAVAITATCTLVLDNTPPDQTQVNVFFDGQPIAQAGENGWSLSGSTVTLLGTACASVQNGDVLDVRVVAGCKTVLR